MKRTFTLTNKGALGTKFEFFKVTGQKERTVTTAATSLGGLVSICEGIIRGIVEKTTSIIDCIWVIKDLKRMAVHVKFDILTLFFIHL